MFTQYEYGSQPHVGGSSSPPHIGDSASQPNIGGSSSPIRHFSLVDEEEKYSPQFSESYHEEQSSIEELEEIQEEQSKRHKSSDDSSFNVRGSEDGNFYLNNTAGDEEVRPRRPIGRDRAKRREKAGTSATSSTTGFDVESLAKLMVKEYAIVTKPYSVQKG
ncbi:hypothetical protein Tco_0567317 [Tanacetum coccineum]